MTSARLLAAPIIVGALACSPSRTLATDGGQGPTLTALSVAPSDGADAPPLLVPPFSASVHDYYVQCASGTNALTLSMAASPGAESQLLQPIQSPRSPHQTFSLNALENQAMVVAATDGTAITEYWVRCLPHDFPPQQMTAHTEAGTPPAGYYLIGNTNAPSGEAAYAMVVNGDGVPVWYGRTLTPGIGVFNVDNVLSGAISFIGTVDGLSIANHPYEIHQLSSSKTTYVSVSGAAPDEHELRALSNGDYLVIWDPIVTGVDLTGLTLPLVDGGVESFGLNSNILACDIVEVDPNGNVVWQWNATDHFDPVKDMTYLTPALIEPSGMTVVEPFHCNSIEVDVNGNLLISSRHMDSIFYIERSTGKVLWKMGGATYTKDNGTYVPVADPFYRQHDARFPNGWKAVCSGGSGQISLFDDETDRPGVARGVVYDVRVGTGTCESDGGGTSGATVAWQYCGANSVAATGSFRVSEDGSRVIGWGENGGFVFSEVDANGNDLLDFYFTGGSSSYRAIKVPLAAFDLSVLRATAGLPLGGPGDDDIDGGLSDGGTVGDIGAADSGNPTDGETGDADTVDGSSGNGTGCYVVTGNGSTQQCSYAWSNEAGFTCSLVVGSGPGSCPSSGLYGCCIEAQPTDSGAESITATCYYAASDGAGAASACEFDGYQGMPFVWQTSVP